MLLVSGRPSIFAWISSDSDGTKWSRTSVIAAHNDRVNDPSLRYSSSLAAIQNNTEYFGSCPGDHGRWCTPAGNVSDFRCTAWCETTSYTSVIPKGGDHFTIVYDRLAGGWAGPPGAFGAEDRVFSMDIHVKTDLMTIPVPPV